MSAERFPILAADKTRRSFGNDVPWAAVEVIRKEASQYHGQSLETLARRGGLSWAELGNLFVIHFGGKDV